MTVGVDLIEIARIRRALERLPLLPRALLHRGRARLLRLAAEPGAALRRALRGQGGGRQVDRLRDRPRVRLAGRRDRRAAEARRAAVGAGRAHGPSEVGAPSARPLDDALARARRGGLRRATVCRCFEPLYTAEEMKAAEAGHDVAGADGARRAGRWPRRRCAASRTPARSARSAAAARTAATGGSRSRCCAPPGREAAEGADGDVLIDALFGTGFHGEPRPEAARADRAR